MIMPQSQKSRFVKTGAIVSLLLLVFLWLSPSKPAVPALRPGRQPLRCQHVSRSNYRRSTVLEYSDDEMLKTL